MKFQLVVPGKTREKYLRDGIADFAARLSHHAPVAVEYVGIKKWSNSENEEVIKQQEGALLLKRIAAQSYIVVLDGSGKQLSSEELARQLSAWELQGIGRIAFVIGGALGLSEEVIRRADFVLSLSAMTFTHEMARLLLLEQLYRACSINAGGRYHK